MVYVLFRYPQLSQTFVRDEIMRLRAAGSTIRVLSVDPGDASELLSEPSGDYRTMRHGQLAQIAQDHLWFAVRHPRRYLRFLSQLARTRDRIRTCLSTVPGEARTLIREGGADRVHTHFAWTTATVAAGIAALLGCPASITMHAKDIYTTPPGRLARRLAPFDRLVTVCQFNVGYLRGSRAVTMADPRLSVVDCGIEVPSTYSAFDDVVRDIDVLAVGRLVPKKGFVDLMHALADVKAHGILLRVVLVGDGPSAADLRRAAATLGLGDDVTFAGARPHSEVLELMGRAKVFALPVRPADDGDTDAMPVVLREAMARATPVVTSYVAGIPESVDDTVGWLLPPGRPDALAAALQEALTSPAVRMRRGTAARERALARWTPTHQVRALEQVWARSDLDGC